MSVGCSTVTRRHGRSALIRRFFLDRNIAIRKVEFSYGATEVGFPAPFTP